MSSPGMTWGAPLGQQQQPPPPQSPEVQQPGGPPGTYVLDPSNSQFGGTYTDFSTSPVSTGYSPGCSASTQHNPFVLLRDERPRNHL